MPPAAHARARRRRTAAAVLALVLPALATPPRCASAAGAAVELRDAVRRLAEAGLWPPGEVRLIVSALERQTQHFLVMPAGTAARETGEALLDVLVNVHAGLSKRIDAMRGAVLERDEDLQALLESPAFRDRQVLALTALYSLSWVRYRQATLRGTGAPERRALLEQAIRGFTEFVYVNEIPDLYGDCLYGRALAFHALGERNKAVADLEAVLELGSRHPAYERARTALTAVRTGKPIELTPAADPRTAELARLRNLLHAHTLPPAAAPAADGVRQRQEGQREVLALGRELAGRDAGSSTRVEAVVDGVAAERSGAFVEVLRADLAGDGGDDTAARMHYERALAASDPDASSYRSRALFGAAVAAYRTGAYAEATAGFARLLDEAPEFEHTETVLYFRFKATEAEDAARSAGGGAPALAHAPADAHDDAYDYALGAYLDRFPGGQHAPELRYRRAERQWRHGDCVAALDTLGTPTGADTWSLAARHIVVQCETEAARTAWRGEGGEAEAHYTAALGNARALARVATEGDDERVRDLGARASIVAALLAATASPPRSTDVVTLLGNFETRFPTAGALVGDAVALRAVARARLGDVTGARSDIATLAASPDGIPADRLRQVGRELVRDAERPDARNREALLELARSVYTALGREQASDDGPGRGQDGIRAADLATLGEIGLALGTPAQAADAYARLRVLDPESLEGIRGGARAAVAAGREAEALALWSDLAARSEPGATLWYEGMLEAARMEERLGRRTDACARLADVAAASGRAPAGTLGDTATTLRQQLCP